MNICPWLVDSSLLRLDVTRGRWALALEKYWAALCITCWQYELLTICVLDSGPTGCCGQGPLPGCPPRLLQRVIPSRILTRCKWVSLREGFCSKEPWERKGNREVREASWLSGSESSAKRTVDILCSILMSFLFNCVNAFLKDENGVVSATSLQDCKCT